MLEIWRDIKDYEGLYQVSNLGRVKSLERYTKRKNGMYHIRECILKLCNNGLGYKVVNLRKNNKYQMYTVHRLVAEAFIPNPENKPCIDHINTIRDDNRVDNLRWVTYSENNLNIITRKHMSESLKGENAPLFNKTGKEHPSSKPVLQYDLDGNFIKEWECTMEIQRELGISNTHISACCLHKPHCNTAGGYIWKYKN